MAFTTETVHAGQWVRHLTNAPERPWRYLEEIADDPFGNPDVVVLKFSNGDGDRLHAGHLAVINDAMFDTAQRMWDVSDEKPSEGYVAAGSTAPRWLCEGKLVGLIERTTREESWIEATLDGLSGRQVVEIPTEALQALRSELVAGAKVEVIVPPLSSGVPGIIEVRAAGRTWTSRDGVPVTRGFLNAYQIVEEADRTRCDIVAFVYLDLELPAMHR
jgi:hypothetical protein